MRTPNQDGSRLARLCAVLVTLASVAVSGAARAQDNTFYLERIQLGGAPDDGLVVWRPIMHERTRFYGSAALGFTLNPLRGRHIAEDPAATRRVDTPMAYQTLAHVGLGMELMQRFGLNLQMPVALLQGGDDPAEVASLDNSGPALHDIRLDGRVRAYESPDGLTRLGGGVAVWTPTGNTDRFASDNQLPTYIYGAAEFDLGDFVLSGNVGPHFRPTRGIFSTVDRQTVLSVGSELRFATGAFVTLRDGATRIGGSLWGTTGIAKDAQGESTFFGTRNTSLEWLAELRMPLLGSRRHYWMAGGGTRFTDGYGSPDLRLIASVGSYILPTDFKPETHVAVKVHNNVDMYDKDTDGDGFPDSIDLCPTVKEDGRPPRPADGCPGPADRDGDGIYDDEDKCPDDPEDKDGIEDADGCPEDDADGDGILDAEDACPLVKGVEQDDPKKNGCPKKREKIVEEEGEIKLLEAIQFETAKATIKPVSFPILDEVVDVLNTRPEIRIAVHGHTDSRGSQWMNMKLSKDRAASVVAYLVDKGIAATRLESDGFGPNQPVASNATDEGRAKNRRVEFKILQPE